jgi:hypothetical protein
LNEEFKIVVDVDHKGGSVRLKNACAVVPFSKIHSTAYSLGVTAANSVPGIEGRPGPESGMEFAKTSYPPGIEIALIKVDLTFPIFFF